MTRMGVVVDSVFLVQIVDELQRFLGMGTGHAATRYLLEITTSFID
jgi:hypothetical protein